MRKTFGFWRICRRRFPRKMKCPSSPPLRADELERAVRRFQTIRPDRLDEPAFWKLVHTEVKSLTCLDLAAIHFSKGSLFISSRVPRSHGMTRVFNRGHSAIEVR